MAPHLFCQSCTMPIDNIGDRGIEKNGSVSDEYCKYCYQQGVFTAPGITIGRNESIYAIEDAGDEDSRAYRTAIP